MSMVVLLNFDDVAGSMVKTDGLKHDWLDEYLK